MLLYISVLAYVDAFSLAGVLVRPPKKIFYWQILIDSQAPFSELSRAQNVPVFSFSFLLILYAFWISKPGFP